MQLENLETGVGDQCRKEFTGMWGYRGEDRAFTRPEPTSWWVLACRPDD